MTDDRAGRQADRQRQQETVERRRRMAAIFGDPLPERTRDEVAEGDTDAVRGGPGHDDWLRSQVPPHHG